MSVPGSVAARRRPRPLLSQRAEARLGRRHREVLDELEALFLRDGFSGFSVRELAASVGCSRRTLYEVAPSKDELVLIVLDRFLHRVGRAALDSIDTTQSYADQITAYFVDEKNAQLSGSRPLCAYPNVMQYDGKGDPRDVSSFSCGE